MRTLPALLALLFLLLSGCFQTDPAGTSSTSGTEGTTAPPGSDTGTAATGIRYPNAPSGDNVGKRPIEDIDANVTGEFGNVTMFISNNMTDDAYLFLAFRPRSLVPEEPCNVMNLHVPAMSQVEIACRLNLLSDGMLVVGAEWFARANSSAIPEAVARHTSEAGSGRNYRFEVHILARSAMHLDRVL